MFISVLILEKEDDFRLQKPLVVEAVEKAGGRVIFGTKFHPELMAIENGYRDISAYLKRHNIVGKSTGFVERICESYNHVDITNVSMMLLLIRSMILLKICIAQSMIF